MKKKIRNIKQSLKSFNMYMPKYQLAVDEMALAVNQIKVDIRERLNALIRETDHSFALENYEYVTKILNNDDIARIYR